MLSDVSGILLGHHSMGDTGTTALVSADPAGMVAAVDVRGGGPGTRETDLLAPHNTVERVHAIVLTGGSAFGLAAADGAMRELESRGIGFPVFGDDVPGPRVPIVPAAVIFDLVVGSADHRPGPDAGAAAVAAALDKTSTGAGKAHSGNLGAGCGATAGVLRGGFGRALISVDGFNVAAYVVANPMGSVVDVKTGRLFGDPTYPAVNLQRFVQLERPMPKLNTTIGVIATDAALVPTQLQRLAMTGHDGLARAVRPAHSPLDGDTLFAVSSAAPNAYRDGAIGAETLATLSAAAADAVQAAIVDAVVHATSAYGVEAWSDIAD